MRQTASTLHEAQDLDLFRRAVDATLAVHHPASGGVCADDGQGWPCRSVQQVMRFPALCAQDAPELPLGDRIRYAAGDPDVFARVARWTYDLVLDTGQEVGDERLVYLVAGRSRPELERRLAMMLAAVTSDRDDPIPYLGVPLNHSDWARFVGHLHAALTEACLPPLLLDALSDEIARYYHQHVV